MHFVAKGTALGWIQSSELSLLAAGIFYMQQGIKAIGLIRFDVCEDT